MAMTTTNHDQGATLVLGGTGKTGRRVAERLRGRGRQVRIGSRSAIPPFDWADRSSWAPVLDGVSSVYLAYAPDAGFPGAAETIGAFAELAVACGARRVVLLTGRGEAGAELSEQALRESGADWTIVRSSFFAQNFSEDFMVEAVRAGVVAFPGRNDRAGHPERVRRPARRTVRRTTRRSQRTPRRRCETRPGPRTQRLPSLCPRSRGHRGLGRLDEPG